MKAFLDTSVLVATFYRHHRHYEPSKDLFLRQQKATGCTAAHCLAEFYAVATGFPGRDRASPQEALLFLDEISERLTFTALEAREYRSVIEDAVRSGISGGGIYDAIIARCASRAKAEVIYTWNLRHFERLGPEVAVRVREP